MGTSERIEPEISRLRKEHINARVHFQLAIGLSIPSFLCPLIYYKTGYVHPRETAVTTVFSSFEPLSKRGENVLLLLENHMKSLESAHVFSKRICALCIMSATPMLLVGV